MSEIIFSSSYDDKYPPENIFNSSSNFFTTTGMFPQEICLQFKKNNSIHSVNLSAYGIKKIMIESCEDDSGVKFVKQAEQNEIPFNNKLQNIKIDFHNNPNVKVLKIEILEGYEDFCAIKKLDII